MANQKPNLDPLLSQRQPVTRRGRDQRTNSDGGVVTDGRLVIIILVVVLDGLWAEPLLVGVALRGQAKERLGALVHAGLPVLHHNCDALEWRRLLSSIREIGKPE